MYKNYVKRLIDIILSLSGLILASWLYLIIIIAIKIDDPGPVFFGQKRVGQGKTYFTLGKFRSMKMSTPHDTPPTSCPTPKVTLLGLAVSCVRLHLMKFLSCGIS